MPSFDIVSEVDSHELANAVDQANREVGNRFDFKGTDTRIEQQDLQLAVISESEFQVRQVLGILHLKLANRGVELGALDEGRVVTTGKSARLDLTVRQGIDQDTARQLVKDIKQAKLKVQASIQGDKVRVTGKKRDDLQKVISNLKDSDPGLPLQYINFRD